MKGLGAPAVSLLVAFAGLLHAWSIAFPWGGQSAWWLQIATLTVFCACLDRVPSKRHGAWLGWLFGTAWLSASFWWLFTSMHVYGGLPSPLAVVAVFLLAAVLSTYLGIACLAYVAWAPIGIASRAALFSGLWLLVELARGRWFTGFPWGAGGYAHVQGPLSLLAPWVGVYGIGAVAALLASLLSALFPPKPFARGHWASSPAPQQRSVTPRPAAGVAAPLVISALILTVLQLVDHSFTRSAGFISVSLLQGNIPQDEKFKPGSGLPLALSWYGEQLHAADLDLVIAPETAIPLLHRQLPSGYWAELTARFSRGEQAALIGMPAGDAVRGYSNAVFGLKPAQAVPFQYDKHHLVPFGEFVPPLFRWFTRMMEIPLGDFARGALGQGSFEWRGQRIAPNVCYEDLFGEELAVRFSDQAQAPTMFANLSNIAWFGESIAIDQHLGISRMRAMEFERPFVRSTNTGATAIIDHRGTVTHVLPRATRGVLRGEVEGRIGSTPYAVWVGALGLWPLWLLGASVVFTAAILRRGT